ncbi:unnamed protein product [Ectocarpus sp. 6 AP-2014]
MGLSLHETIFFSCFLLPRTYLASVQVELNMGGRRAFARVIAVTCPGWVFFH